MNCTVVTSCYGTFHNFAPRWAAAVGMLDPAPYQVIVGADKHVDMMPGVKQKVSVCRWNHPQAYYLDKAIRSAQTEWVWIVDMDDHPFVGGLHGLDEVTGDVWQIGFISNGQEYTPIALPNDEYLASNKNPYVGSSMIRVGAYLEVGGFPDVALQDWALWRRLARNGAVFQASGRSHFHYNRHPGTRGSNELTIDVRPQHLVEMMESELAYA